MGGKSPEECEISIKAKNGIKEWGLLTCQWTSVEFRARCVAQLQSTIFEMCLRLKESNSIIQLSGHRFKLIVCWENPDESRIVGTDLCNIGVGTGAQCRVPIAGDAGLG